MKSNAKCPKWIEVTVKVCLTLFAIVVVAVCLFASWPSIDSKLKSKRFDSLTWNQNKEDVMWPNRLRMVDNLIASRLLIGKSRSEIVSILGPDDKNSGYFKDWHSVYQLGPERGFIRIDSEWLVINFDLKGQCLEAIIKRD